MASSPRSNGGARRDYEIQVQYHDGANAVTFSRMKLSARTSWEDVTRWAAETSGYAAAAFGLEDENGSPVGGGGGGPLAWVQADQQRRPYRTVILKRHNNPADLSFARNDIAAAAHVGLINNTINSGVDTTTMLSAAPAPRFPFPAPFFFGRRSCA